MKKTELLILLMVFLIGFVAGIIGEQHVFFSIGYGLALLIFSVPITLIIFLSNLLLRKLNMIGKPPSNNIEYSKPRFVFRIYLWHGIILGSLLVLQKIFDIIPQFIG